MAKDCSLDQRTILVGNIHSCVTEEILYELFLQAGPVEKVHIFRDDHQEPHGFVYYKHTEAVPYALQLLNGIWLYGQPIKLQCKTGVLYQDCALWYANTENGLIANSKNTVLRDHMTVNVNGSPSVENHSNAPHRWSDMMYNSPAYMCPPVMSPAMWYCPPLQLWTDSGCSPWASYKNENSFLFRSDSTTVGCSNVDVEGSKHCKHRRNNKTICSPRRKHNRT